MLNRVAAATLGAQYGAERDEHDKLAGPWTKLGWALLFALIAGSGLVFATMFWNLGISDIDTTSRLLRQTALFGALATGIALAFRRAAYHRRREERAKRIEDELSLLTPFIDRLDPVQQDALLYIVAPRYFLGGTPGARGPDDGATMIEMLRHVRQRASGEESSEGQSDNQ